MSDWSNADSANMIQQILAPGNPWPIIGATAQKKEQQDEGEDEEGAAASEVDTGVSRTYPSTEEQANQRRLARMAKYFTSPTGTLESNTGSAGVF